MTKPYSDSILPKTRHLLWAIAAGRCEFEGCNKIVYRDWVTKKRGTFAEVAHIIGNRLDVPGREKTKLSQDYCNNVENLMLLCPEHHKLIDYECPRDYPDELLRKMKTDHEDRIQRLTGITKDKTSIPIKYGSNIDVHDAIISDDDAYHALSLIGRFPARERPIKLGITNSTLQDSMPEYWQFQLQELVNQFDRDVRPHLQGENSHFSVFALAPIPLLIKLGTLLSDVHRAEVFQLHREPATWDWQPDVPDSEYIVEEPEVVYDKVALIIALSDRVRKERVFSALGTEKVSVWTLTISEPDKDYLKGQNQLQLFRETLRKLYGDIKYKHGEEQIIHLFPVLSVAPAIEIGRVRQPKADLPLVIYDENKTVGGFIETIRIGNLRSL